MSLRVYTAVYKAALLQKMEYRVDFALGVITAMMLRLSSLAFLLVVLHQAPTLSGWTSTQVVFLSGLTAMTLGFSELFFNNVWMVPYYIVMGDMDRLLVYPVRTLLFLLVSSPVVHAFGNLLVGSCLAFTGLLLNNVPSDQWLSALTTLNGFQAALALNPIPLLQWLWVPVWAICGCLIYTSCLVIAASLSFKFVGPYSNNLFFVHQLLSANQYPLSIFPHWLEMAITVLLPFGAAIYLPSGWLFGKFTHTWYAFAGPVAAIVFVGLAFQAWEWGLKRYESTGS